MRVCIYSYRKSADRKNIENTLEFNMCVCGACVYLAQSISSKTQCASDTPPPYYFFPLCRLKSVLARALAF